MGKYGEFTIIIDKNREGIFNILAYDLFGLLKRDEEFYYKYNTDIIYTFYDDLEQSYSQREIYTLTNNYSKLFSILPLVQNLCIVALLYCSI